MSRMVERKKIPALAYYISFPRRNFCHNSHSNVDERYITSRAWLYIDNENINLSITFLDPSYY